MLYIMRHGKTDWNAVHRLQGSEDIPLNEEGRQMARDARKKYGDLRFDICYCSPLQRAQETAEIFLEGSGTPILTDDRLREMGFGMYEGTEHVTQKPECPVYTLFHDPVHYHAVDGAESLEHLYAHSGSFIHDVLTPEVVSGKNVLIVAHGALDCSLICQYEEIPLEHFWDQLLGNCELRRLVSSANV